MPLTFKDLNSAEKADSNLLSRNEIIESNNRVVRAYNDIFRSAQGLFRQLDVIMTQGFLPDHQVTPYQKMLVETYKTEVARHKALIAKHNGVYDAAQNRKNKAESEFYLEVKEELMAEGKAEHVAANLINTEAKLLEQARRLGVI